MSNTCSECENKILCPICGNVLGTFDGKEAIANEGIAIRQGIIYFVCSKDGTEVNVCKNTWDITLKSKRQII